MNTLKEGYSVDEIAQVLHCTRATVVHYIDCGELQANVYPKEKVPGKKRRIRITKEHVQAYMRSHRTRFDKDTLSAWNVDASYKPVKVETSSSYPATSLSELTGAWAGLVNAAEDLTTPKEETPAAFKPQTEIPSYSVHIDGRVAIGNVSADTMSKIIDALLHDEQISYNELKIAKGVSYK